MQSNRLIHRKQLMKPVLPERTNAQTEINLRERSDSDSHGRTIVNSIVDFDCFSLFPRARPSQTPLQDSVSRQPFSGGRLIQEASMRREG
jgi:hypothetical protein